MANRSPFTNEFVAAHNALKGGSFDKSWESIVNKLVKLTEAEGPHDSRAGALDDLRKQAKTIGDGGLFKKATEVAESEGLLIAAGGYDRKSPSDASGLTSDSRKRAAALKLLRHFYLLRQRGSHKLWICSLPDSFKAWPSDAMNGANIAKLKLLLGDTTEHFSQDDKKNLSDATQESLKWCHKTLILLANAASTKAKKAAPGRDLVKLWFADANSSEDDITAAVSTLQAGFKKIQAVLNSGHLVLTDHAEVRGATSGENRGFWESEAFVKGAKEAMDVVYIESAFFGTANTLQGLKNWARILVHELSHREVRTKDKFYSWQGIKPVAGGFPMADALDNADSWAFFCADAAGQLTDTERNTALK